MQPDNKRDPMTLEVIATTVTDAVAAESGGADRIELIDNYLEGGTTPSAGIVRAVKKSVSIPVYVMIRPHGGGFGGHANPFEGRHVIAELVAQKRLSIMIGGGVMPNFLPQVIAETGVREVHVGVAARVSQTSTSPVRVERVRKLKKMLESCG